MKHKFTGALIGLVMFALAGAHAQAGEINANEQSLISAVSQSFFYNGATYVVKSAYIAEGRAKLSEDGVDLSASQAQGYISQFYGSYQELVSEGYCDVVSEAAESGAAESTPEPEHSKKVTKANKLMLKTILGKPEKSEETTESGKTQNMQEATAQPTATANANSADAWDKEEDLGTSISFEDVDRNQAKERKVTISGIGEEYTIDASEQSGASGKEAVRASDNFLDRVLRISALRVLFWVALAIAVLSSGSAVYYIVAVKRRHHKKRGLRRGIAVGMGVGIGAWAFLLMVAVSLYFGVYNTGSIQRQLMESDYFLGVTQMIRETVQEQLKEAGCDETVASEVFTLSSVYIEEKQYIAQLLSGQSDAQISADGISEALETELGDDGQKIIPQLEETYRQMLEFELGNVIYQSRSHFIGWFYAIVVVSIVWILALFVLACRLYGYPHKAARLVFAALMSSSCLVAGAALVMRLLQVVSRIEATPVYYLQFLQKYASWSISVLFYVGCLGILVSIALLIWKRYLHTIYAE